MPLREPDPGVEIRGGGTRAVKGEQGLITSVEKQATEAGVELLVAGGNVVDAIVACAFALSVTHPSAGNIGGGGFLMLHIDGQSHALDFRETAPRSLTQARFDEMIATGAVGPVAVGVPGSVAGLVLAHERFGRLPLTRVLEPAVRLARHGYLLGKRQANTLRWNWKHLAKQEAFKKLYADASGQPQKAGTKLTRPALATTLRQIAARGAKGFYAGSVAESMVQAMGNEGGLAISDLADYRARFREPLIFYYRGLKVVTMPPPSAGGVALTQTLLMLERLRAFEHPRLSAQNLHLFVEAARRAHAERRFGVVDPDALNPEALDKLYSRWLDPLALTAAHPIDRATASRSRDIHPYYEAAAAESENTTHLAAVDRSGNAASLTTTLSAGFGAKLMTSDTGIILNNAVASFSTKGMNTPAPGRRTLSSMCPTLVYAGNRLVAVLGSPGGDSIPNTVAQVLRNLADYGLTIDDAVDAPRVHHGFVPDALRYETARPIPRLNRGQLQKLGHRVRGSHIPLGDANSIVMTSEGIWGYADPREGGLVLSATKDHPADQ